MVKCCRFFYSIRKRRQPGHMVSVEISHRLLTMFVNLELMKIFPFAQISPFLAMYVHFLAIGHMIPDGTVCCAHTCCILCPKPIAIFICLIWHITGQMRFVFQWNQLFINPKVEIRFRNFYCLLSGSSRTTFRLFVLRSPTARLTKEPRITTDNWCEWGSCGSWHIWWTTNKCLVIFPSLRYPFLSCFR